MWFVRRQVQAWRADGPQKRVSAATVDVLFGSVPTRGWNMRRACSGKQSCPWQSVAPRPHT